MSMCGLDISTIIIYRKSDSTGNSYVLRSMLKAILHGASKIQMQDGSSITETKFIGEKP
jgi:hypothetical protein